MEREGYSFILLFLHISAILSFFWSSLLHILSVSPENQRNMGLEGVSQAQAVTVSLKELIDGAYRSDLPVWLESC